MKYLQKNKSKKCKVINKNVDICVDLIEKMSNLCKIKKMSKKAWYN